MRWAVLTLALCSAPSLAQDSQASLDIICGGGGSANKSRGAVVSGWDSNGDYGSAIVRRHADVGFEDQVSIKIEGAAGQLRMPRTMLPAIHGGSDGWFTLKNIKYTDGEITASVSVSPLNNPKLRLDRYTGAVSISGKSGDFTGQCRKFDPATTQRQF